jgi:hypothetical protein
MLGRDIHGAAEMLDEFLAEPPYSKPFEDSLHNYEHVLGHAVLRGEIDVAQALQALADYEAWQAAGEPKLTTMQGQFIFDSPKPL